MKKIFATILTFVVLLVGLSALTTTPANASQVGSVVICHSNNGVKDFTQNTVNKNSIVKANGHGADSKDIIPPFEYTVRDKESTQNKYFAGLNWNPDGSSAAFVNNNCKTPLVPVVAVPPTFEPATCINLSGIVNLAAQPAGVKTEGVTAVREGSVWRVTYTVTDPEVYSMAPNNSTVFLTTINEIPTTDPLWDAATGKCLLPDTGADANTTHVVLAAGALVLLLGAFMLIGSRRKKNNQ